MSGKIKTLIDLIVDQRAKGDPLLIEMTKTKMIMKGIEPNKYTFSTPDDEKVIQKLKDLAKEFGVNV